MFKFWPELVNPVFDSDLKNNWFWFLNTRVRPIHIYQLGMHRVHPGIAGFIHLNPLIFGENAYLHAPQIILSAAK